jgi:hypothetical protein
MQRLALLPSQRQDRLPVASARCHALPNHSRVLQLPVARRYALFANADRLDGDDPHYDAVWDAVDNLRGMLARIYN